MPDVWILGGYIIGKWIFWWGILFAWIGQTLGILLYYALFHAAYRMRSDAGLVVVSLIPAGILLAFFPFWTSIYVEGVIDNSDEVCFFTHYSIGWLIYGAIACLTSWLIVCNAFRAMRLVI